MQGEGVPSVHMLNVELFPSSSPEGKGNPPKSQETSVAPEMEFSVIFSLCLFFILSIVNFHRK